MSDRFVLAQISDMHVRADWRADGFDPSEDLRRALDAIEAFGADAIIATGDLVNDERADEYAALADILQAPPAPLFLVPGNHDAAGPLREAFADHRYLPESGPLSYVVDDYPLRIVALDQTVPGQTNGDITPDCAEWLDTALSAAPDKPTLVALHHPPFPTYDLLLDTIGLAHPERFAEVIARHPQVGRIVCGHHHRAVIGQVAHVPVFVAPSTAWAFGLQLKPNQPPAKREPQPRGWALHVWTAAGGIATHFMSL